MCEVVGGHAEIVVVAGRLRERIVKAAQISRWSEKVSGARGRKSSISE
jgi:hypothetical protein